MSDRYNEDVVFMDSREKFVSLYSRCIHGRLGFKKKFWFAILKILYSWKMRVREKNKVFYESRRSHTSVLANYCWVNS